jgi:hypothetical protein
MQIAHALFRFVMSSLRPTKGIFEAAVALVASIAQFGFQLWRSGPATDAKRVKEIFFRRLEAGTRSIEADADKKAAEAQRVYAGVAKVHLGLIASTRDIGAGKLSRKSGCPTRKSRSKPCSPGEN